MAKKPHGMAARHATPKKPKRKPKQVLRPAQRFGAGSIYRADEDLRPAATPSPAMTRTRFRSTIQAVSTDYHYVVNDLKRIVIIAGALLAVMIFLTFIVK